MTSQNNGLSMKSDQTGITNIPLASLEGMFVKAGTMLNTENAILPAPGGENAFMVLSNTGKKPHYVKLDNRTYKVTCEDCPGWKSFNVCGHAIAVAEKLGQLKDYVEWFKRRGKSNLTTFITYDCPAGIGRKGSKPATSRRRGGRQKTTPTHTVSRFQNIQNQVQPQCHPPNEQSQSHLPNATGNLPVVVPTPNATDNRSFVAEPQVPVHHQPSNNTNVMPPLYQPVIQNAFSPAGNGQFVIQLLSFCPPQVSKCFGCGQLLKPGGVIMQPPFDLVVVSRMNRQFTDSSGLWHQKEGNVYFHAVCSCIQRKQPYFMGQAALSIPVQIQPFLTDQHKHHLANEFRWVF